jgi:fumarate hydratase class II
VVFQTGSGTQSNMNVNEVRALIRCVSILMMNTRDAGHLEPCH